MRKANVLPGTQSFLEETIPAASQFRRVRCAVSRSSTTHAPQPSGVEAAVAVAYITAVLIPIAGIIVGAGLIANDKTRREDATAVVLSLIMCGVYLFVYLAVLN